MIGTSTFPRSTSRGPRAARLALILLAWGGLAHPARAQQTSGTPGDVDGGSTPRKSTKVADLVNRYRFIERYAQDERATPGSVATYRVGVVEVVKDSVERAQGGPKLVESTRQSVFVERATETTSQGVVAGSVRAFERFRLRPEDPSRSMGARPLEGLTILYRPKIGEAPLLLSLTEGRTLTEFEFDVASRLPYLPHLPAIFPGQPARVGDTWKVSKRGVQALLGEAGIQGDALTAKFVELRKEDDGPRKVAVVSILGKATTPSGETTVNAEARFTFEPVDPSKANPGAPTLATRAGDDQVEARGAITDLRMTRASGGPLPGPGRLRYTSTREISLQRQLGLAAESLPLPKVGTTPTIADPNAWLTLIEPAGRFSLQHPQDFLAPERGLSAPAEANAAMLVRNLRQGVDTVRVEFVPRTLQPEDLKAKLAEKWGATKLEIVKGAEEWLPEADWPRVKVHRIEALVKTPDRPSPSAKPAPKAGGPASAPAPPSAPAGAPARIHFDAYLLQFGQAASVLAIATTSREAVGPFRREVEQILKSIQVDPPRPAVD